MLPGHAAAGNQTGNRASCSDNMGDVDGIGLLNRRKEAQT